jgi:hypothetical protein
MPLIIFLIVATWARLSWMVLTIGPTIGDFHQLCDGFRIFATKFFDVRFSSDVIAKGVDCPVNGNIFGCVQKFGEASDV